MLSDVLVSPLQSWFPRPITRGVALAVLSRLSGRLIVVVAMLIAIASSAQAELTSIKILRREPFAEGKSFGDVGPYERILAHAKYEIDPAHPRNQGIVDLDLAPRNTAGKVEIEADVDFLAPVDLSKGNGAIFMT